MNTINTSPHITFALDKEKDLETFLGFMEVDEIRGSQTLEWAILKPFPKLMEYFDGGKFIGEKSIVEELVEEVYKKDQEEMQKNFFHFEQNWKKIEKEFFALADTLFLGRPWPRGKYMASPTICGMFPRFLDDKTFQLPYRTRDDRNINVIIAHEMLHFLFYDYFLEKHPDFTEEDTILWHTSEIFNVIIQNLPEWVKVFEIPEEAYPEHQEIVKKIQTEKRGDWNVDELIERIMIEVKNDEFV